MLTLGPFFYIKNTLIVHSLPLTECRKQADKLDNPYGHDRLWDAHFRYGDYIDWPRGRVVWDRTNDRAIIYIDRCIDKPEVIERIREAFGLTECGFVVEHDDHYRCRKCVGELFADL